MKNGRKLIIFTIGAALWIFSGGCGEAEPPEAVSEMCPVKPGSCLSVKRERHLTPARWAEMECTAEIFSTPVSYTIYRVDFLLTGLDIAEVEQRTREAWKLPGFRGGECRLKKQIITVKPALELGLNGIRLSVTDLEAAEINGKEALDPQAALNRCRNKISEDILLIEEACENFRTDNGRYPRILNELTENLLQLPEWNGPYIRPLPRDPWQRDYKYDLRSGQIFSGGADGNAKLR